MEYSEQTLAAFRCHFRKDELEKLDVKRPGNMKGIEKMADVDAVLRSITTARARFQLGYFAATEVQR